MKTIPYILILLLAGYIIYKLFYPTIETKTEYIKGETVKDTAETVLLRSKIDSLEYWFVAKLDSIKKVKPRIIKGKNTIDTVYIDTTVMAYSSKFDLGTDTLGTSGRVYFDMKDFGFSNIKYRYPEATKTITITRVDTMKINKTITSGFRHGPVAGFGYGLINKEFDVFVGYGVTYAF